MARLEPGLRSRGSHGFSVAFVHSYMPTEHTVTLASAPDVCALVRLGELMLSTRVDRRRLASDLIRQRLSGYVHVGIASRTRPNVAQRESKRKDREGIEEMHLTCMPVCTFRTNPQDSPRCILVSRIRETHREEREEPS